MTEILIKRLSDNVSLPKYETEGSSGMDLAANINEKIEIKKIDYYFSNSIARASKTMSDCRTVVNKQLKNGKIIFDK